VSAYSDRRARSRGFTLIEVLVAFVILAGSVLALMRLLSGGLAMAERTDEFNRATTYAENRLAEAVGQREIVEGETSGEEDEGRIRWSVVVTPMDDPTPPPGGQQPGQAIRVKLMEIVATVRFGPPSDTGQERAVTLRTIRVVPKKVGET
jgi:general secretion pathway protein I